MTVVPRLLPSPPIIHLPVPLHTSNKCSTPSGSQGTAQTTKHARRTKWELMNTPSFIECINKKLSPVEKMIVKVAGQFYLEDLCTNTPWPTAELKKKKILECLSQANAHAAQFGQVTVEESSEITGQVSHRLSHGNLTNNLQVGHAGSNFRGAVKALIVKQIGEFWPIMYSCDKAKQKTVEECMSYMRQRVHNLLCGDAFASQGSWLSPTGMVSFIHYFYEPI